MQCYVYVHSQIMDSKKDLARKGWMRIVKIMDEEMAWNNSDGDDVSS
jgi:hypothetical protein